MSLQTRYVIYMLPAYKRVYIGCVHDHVPNMKIPLCYMLMRVPVLLISCPWCCTQGSS
jgi:hypothetical protein